MRQPEGRVTAVIGTQWGDEGKGKIVDYLAKDYKIVARPAGGPNTGHTVNVDGRKYKLHGLPEGVLRPSVLNVIGPGALIDPIKLVAEIENYQVPDRSLAISDHAHLITPVHIALDEMREADESKRQGSTKSGIAFAAADKYRREGILLGEANRHYKEIYDQIVAGLSDLSVPNPESIADQWLNCAEQLTKYATDTTVLLNHKLRDGQNILASGTQSHWLDIDEQPYPYGSSTHTGAGGIVTGLQVPPYSIDQVIGVMKGFKSRVGDGPFVTEITDEELAEKVRGAESDADTERGTTSNRPRRVGYLDLVEVRRSILANGINELALTKADRLIRFGNSMLVATAYIEPTPTAIAPNPAHQLEVSEPHYEQIGLWSEADNDRLKRAPAYLAAPTAVRRLVDFLESQLDTEIRYIGTGPDRRQVIVK